MFLRMHHTADFLETETEDRNISSEVLLEIERDRSMRSWCKSYQNEIIFKIQAIKITYFDRHLNVARFNYINHHHFTINQAIYLCLLFVECYLNQFIQQTNKINGIRMNCSEMKKIYLLKNYCII